MRGTAMQLPMCVPGATVGWPAGCWRGNASMAPRCAAGLLDAVPAWPPIFLLRCWMQCNASPPCSCCVAGCSAAQRHAHLHGGLQGTPALLLGQAHHQVSGAAAAKHITKYQVWLLASCAAPVATAAAHLLPPASVAAQRPRGWPCTPAQPFMRLRCRCCTQTPSRWACSRGIPTTLCRWAALPPCHALRAHLYVPHQGRLFCYPQGHAGAHVAGPRDTLAPMWLAPGTRRRPCGWTQGPVGPMWPQRPRRRLMQLAASGPLRRHSHAGHRTAHMLAACPHACTTGRARPAHQG